VTEIPKLFRSELLPDQRRLQAKEPWDWDSRRNCPPANAEAGRLHRHERVRWIRDNGQHLARRFRGLCRRPDSPQVQSYVWRGRASFVDRAERELHDGITAAGLRAIGSRLSARRDKLGSRRISSRVLPPPKRACAMGIAFLKSTACPFNRWSPGRSNAPSEPSLERVSNFVFKPAGRLRERWRWFYATCS